MIRFVVSWDLITLINVGRSCIEPDVKSISMQKVKPPGTFFLTVTLGDPHPTQTYVYGIELWIICIFMFIFVVPVIWPVNHWINHFFSELRSDSKWQFITNFSFSSNTIWRRSLKVRRTPSGQFDPAFH